MIAEERETTVNSCDADDFVYIWTAQRKVITRLRKHPAFREVSTGNHDGSEWAEFRIPAANWNPATGAKRVSNMTPERKQRLADQGRAALAKNATRSVHETELAGSGGTSVPTGGVG